MTDETRALLTVTGVDAAAADQLSDDLVRDLAEELGSATVTRLRGDQTSQDLGLIVEIILNSASLLALTRGVGSWIERHRGANLALWKRKPDGSEESITIGDVDAPTAERLAYEFLNRPS
jgi:hypothetical protein